MTETGSRLLLGVAAVLAGTTVLLGVFGLVYNPLLLLAAVPFAAATYFLWGSATGQLDARMRERVEARRVEHGNDAGAPDDDAPSRRFLGAPRGPGGSGTSRRAPGSGNGQDPRRQGAARSGRRHLGPPRQPPSRTAAASVLDVDPAADEAEIRQAFREKARELHPDAPGGDEAEFRRVRTAYERLTGKQ